MCLEMLPTLLALLCTVGFADGDGFRLDWRMSLRMIRNLGRHVEMPRRKEDFEVRESERW
jgi:hypothetical protein